MMRARQEETFRGARGLQPARRVLQRVVGHDDPFLCYVALVTPFEIAFISSDATLFYINSGGGHLFLGRFPGELQPGVL